jgi:hypothetical protein
MAHDHLSHPSLSTRRGSGTAAAAPQVFQIVMGQADIGQEVGTKAGELVVGGTLVALLAPGIKNSKHFDLLLVEVT